ncbi:tetratricopeptide repeat protein [Alkalihalobacterium elongatum]|uniref:tetratricopeptide repeat protein n=1 Tax=Alkalihalobacterium elongatum TaxID=2675466 RepID=UPI001C1F6ED9|nr:tetratricopeptide repeat protein [Alkalihalobacterium elongatum]
MDDQLIRQLNKAIELRKEGQLKSSNQLILQLVTEYPEDPVVNYQCAWSYDVLGEEAHAVPFYEKAIELGLSDEWLEGAYLGLGSTFRTLGEYEKSQQILKEAINHFPNNYALKVFYSMTLYNLKEHSIAMETLLESLLETTKDEEILKYKKAIHFYSDKLDEVWK